MAAPSTPPADSDATTPPYFAGIDVGGTNIKIGVVDDHGRVAAYRSIPTEQQAGAVDAAARCAQALRQITTNAGIEYQQVARVGLATPGPMDVAQGMLLCPGNLPGWRDSPVRDQFSAATGLPVTFANDANAAAWGEYWRGAGANAHSMVMFTLGTGVGGGIVLGDRLIEGAHGCGGEFGHIAIDCHDNAPLNTMGVRGTLEGYCGSYGVVAQAEGMLARSDEASALRDSRKLTPLAISQAAESGDALAVRVVMNTAKLLAIGVVSVVHAIDPECVVIGGGVNFGGPGSGLGERFINQVRESAKERLFPSLVGKTQIGFARLGSDAGFIGAAGLARRDDQPA